MATSSQMTHPGKCIGMGSDEVPEYVCDPCLTRQVTVKAAGFCAECSENLCEQCLDFHGRSKVSRHHDTFNRSRKGDRTGSTTYSEPWPTHEESHKKPISYERSSGLSTTDKMLTSDDKQLNRKVYGENITTPHSNLYIDGQRFSSLQYKFVINLPNRCSITGCAVLSKDQLVLASHDDKSVYIVDLNKCSVVDQLEFETLYPDDVTALPLKQIAITVESENIVKIIDIVSRRNVKDITLKRRCLKIQNCQNLLYILCESPNSVMVFDLNGDLQREIALPSGNNLPFLHPCALTVSTDTRYLYVCDEGRRLIVKLDMFGGTVAQTSTKGDKQITRPVSLVELDDGSLIVLGGSNIYHVSADLKDVAKLMEVKGLSTLCYMSEIQQIFGVQDENQLLYVYSVEYSSTHACCHIV